MSYALSPSTLWSVVAELSAEYGVTPTDVIISRSPDAARARQDAYFRLRRMEAPEGGPRYSLATIGKAFGVSQSNVCAALNRRHRYKRKRAKLTRPQVHQRAALIWQYGETRARAILAGRDPATQADLARWNALGSSIGDAA